MMMGEKKKKNRKLEECLGTAAPLFGASSLVL
jgi:hypothetical protein